MAKSLRSKIKKKIRASRRLQSDEFFDKTLVPRMSAMEKAMAAEPLPRNSSKASKSKAEMQMDLDEGSEKKGPEKKKKVPVRVPLEMTAMEVEPTPAYLKAQSAGISKKKPAKSVERKAGNKQKIVFHVGKNTAQKKKAKRRAANTK
mmetsp:Transcript_18620/g.25817  ORF Transcript_18620/g.25817 Transcript_18620/m.25817 type:complete len:147 (-) Transcript_18620:271-711(-)|eukprot:CAMPEP_0196579478 /NCGR_PEP_ID=MMETSP1081-20130531/22024_1 /TAXON_ID=36882 /ORGANISM="Pyramimonas amylifera, Strain CCMP720" /LENGTH=146 /DNA_ID=CAMNT_0041899085 /DNA_START=69 /DNA_END=509 /DNA_ORIENTATION=-